MALDTKNKLSNWMKRIIQPSKYTKKTNTNSNNNNNGNNNSSRDHHKNSNIGLINTSSNHRSFRKSNYYHYNNNNYTNKVFYSEATLNLPNDNVSMIPIVPNDNYSIHWDEEIEKSNREILNNRDFLADNNNNKRDSSTDNTSMFPLQPMMTSSIQSASIFSAALGNNNNSNYNYTSNNNHSNNNDQMSFQSTRPTIVSSMFTIDSLASVRPIVPGSILFNSRAPSVRTITS